MGKYTERRCISKTVKPEIIARAYELLSCTDMIMVEVSRALKTNYDALESAITRAEKHGLYIYVRVQDRVSEKSLTYLALNPGKPATPEEVANYYGGRQRSYRQALAKLCKRKVVNREQVKISPKSVAIYGYFVDA